MTKLHQVLDILWMCDVEDPEHVISYHKDQVEEYYLDLANKIKEVRKLLFESQDED